VPEVGLAPEAADRVIKIGGIVIASVPHLFAVASGLDCVGEYHCFYCGAPCGKKHPTATYVKDSFTGRSGVVAPGSRWICEGCVLCLRESCDIVQVDGERRTAQKMRGYSWAITATSAFAATKAHLDRIRAICLEPPEPPFALVLSDSGQTHQLYRGVVNHARDPVVVTLEAERIEFRRAELAALLPIAGRIAAATGKPALAEPMSANVAMRVIDRYRDGENFVETWGDTQGQPIGRLIAWICSAKIICEQEYPSDTVACGEPADRPVAESSPVDTDPGHRGVPPQAGGTGGSAGTASRRGRSREPQTSRQPTLFDLG
jgi:CRISPR type IV-associated protein Csf1